MKKFAYLESYQKRPEQRFYMAGVGLHEEMPAGYVNRPSGTWDWLFMYFHSSIDIRINRELREFPSQTLMIWSEEEAHFYGLEKEAFEHSWIHCQGSILPEALRGSGIRPGVYPKLLCEEILEKYLPLIHEERLRGDLEPLILESLFRCFLQELGRVANPRVTSLPIWIHELKRYLEINYANPIRLDDLSQKFSVSKSHLVSEFKKYLGAPPVEYLIRLRMEHARSHLLDSHLSIGDVAHRVGYDDIYHFSKIFKKYMGKSPSSFRTLGS